MSRSWLGEALSGAAWAAGASRGAVLLLEISDAPARQPGGGDAAFYAAAARLERPDRASGTARPSRSAGTTGPGPTSPKRASGRRVTVWAGHGLLALGRLITAAGWRLVGSGRAPMPRCWG